MINGPKWNVDSYGLMYVTRRSIRTNGRQTRISGWSNWRESIENAIGRRLRPNWVYDYIVFYHDFLVVYSSIFYVDFIDESIGVSLYETLSRKDGLSILQEVMTLSCSLFVFRFKWVFIENRDWSNEEARELIEMAEKHRIGHFVPYNYCEFHRHIFKAI